MRRSHHKVRGIKFCHEKTSQCRPLAVRRVPLGVLRIASLACQEYKQRESGRPAQSGTPHQFQSVIRLNRSMFLFRSASFLAPAPCL